MAGAAADTAIRGGEVLDGTGAPPVPADVVITGDRIAAITPRYEGAARRAIDARGLVVAPGFIDIRTPGTTERFPRLLGRYVRKLRLLSLTEAVWKITGGPARVLRLADRGLLREGYRADVTIFDPALILDRATFEEPSRYPDGIPYVMVNGVPVVDGGAHTEATPGRVLHRDADGVR